MIVSVKFLLPNSILLHTENERILINCPEGTQRYGFEHTFRPAKLTHVLLTSLDASCVAGLPGLLLTLLQAAGQLRLVVAGPPGVIGFVQLILSYFHLADDREDVVQLIPLELPLDAPVRIKSLSLILRQGVLDIDLDPQPGKFNPQGAKAAGVPPGPMYRLLKAGQSVTLDDGRVIHPSVCVLPPIPLPSIRVVFGRTEYGPLEEDNINIVLRDYFAPLHVDLEVFSNAYIPRSLFPHRKWLDFLQSCDLPKLCPASRSADSIGNIDPNSTLLIAPVARKGIEHSGWSDETGEMSSATKVPEFGVIFLGTSASAPAPLRNVSGYVFVADGKYGFVDPGEESHHTATLLLGPDYVENIEWVFVSHNHADHYLGLLTLVDELQKRSLIDRVKVFLPNGVKFFLSTYLDLAGKAPVEVVSCQDVLPAMHEPVITPIFNSQSFAVSAFPVMHRFFAQGIRVVTSRGVIVFTGDTSPCPMVTEATIGASVCIHDSTYLDPTRIEMADARRHSSVFDLVAAAAHFPSTLLVATHLSKRPAVSSFDSVYAGFDGAVIDLNNLPDSLLNLRSWEIQAMLCESDLSEVPEVHF